MAYSNHRIWSISKWRDFEACPAMFVAKHETKEWHEAPNDAMERGKKLHKVLEEAIKYELELPPELVHVKPTIDSFLATKPAGAALYPEMKFGVTKDFQRCEFFEHPELRVRCVLDVFLSLNGNVLITDWKTGKYKGEHKEDAQFYGACASSCFESNNVHVHYNYLDEPHNCFTDRAEAVPHVLKSWWQKFDYADKVLAQENVPRTQCNNCMWCGAYKCPNNKNKKLVAAGLIHVQ